MCSAWVQPKQDSSLEPGPGRRSSRVASLGLGPNTGLLQLISDRLKGTFWMSPNQCKAMVRCYVSHLWVTYRYRLTETTVASDYHHHSVVVWDLELALNVAETLQFIHKTTAEAFTQPLGDVLALTLHNVIEMSELVCLFCDWNGWDTSKVLVLSVT